jgi:hypothetical protein
MAIDEAFADDNVMSVTARHLRELRRGQDLILDLIKRQHELINRLERSLNELKGDVVLMENRSITAAENDEFFRRKIGDIEDKLDQLSGKLGEAFKS